MAKYRKKPVEIEAEVYSEGMEDGIIVMFSGNFLNYDRVFKTMDEARTFINNDEGRLALYEIDKDLEITYEDPRPFIKTLEGNHLISDGDFIITGVKGERYPCKQDIFEMTYDKVE